jgi:hypothetical protein
MFVLFLCREFSRDLITFTRSRPFPGDSPIPNFVDTQRRRSPAGRRTAAQRLTVREGLNNLKT